MNSFKIRTLLILKHQKNNMTKVKVLVFLYNGKKYIPDIEKEYHNQEVRPDCDISLKYILTDTNDGSEEELKNIKADYAVVKKEEFSHSLTREKYILESDADICILLTQDARLEKNDVYQTLIDAMVGDVEYAYLRQINKNRSVERYTRMFNYPKKSRIKTKDDIKELGLNTFFASDACAAVDVHYFREIGGYGKDLPTNEDMWLAYRVIMNGKAVKYCAESYVNHTHKFTLKQVRQRYYLFGQFFGLNKEFDNYSSNEAGLKLALKVVGRMLLEFNLPALCMFVPNMLERLKGKRDGFNSIRNKDTIK